MATSSKDVAKWVEMHLDSDGWQSLSDAILHAIEKVMPMAPIETQTDLAEEHYNYIEEILRDRRAFIIEDGGIPSYELTDADSYIRRINHRNTEIAAKLRLIDPLYFEVVCKRILEKLGATAENTQKSWDGGVDFFALNLTTYSASYPLPKTAALSVIGQAKRYAENHEVKETEIRNFIGGAILKLDELRKQGKINVLGPVVYAFWTTSDLHIHAKQFSRKMGIWHLDGMALAEYVLKLELVSEIFPEDEQQG